MGYYLVYVLQVCLFLVVAKVPSSDSFISGDVLRNHRSSGRNLLQTLRECPLDLEHANYTILTSKCKGPEYKKTLCCPALGEFACPYVEYLNDVSYDCSSRMFNYIDTRGYPKGLFSSECRKDIPCPSTDSPRPTAGDDGASAASLRLLPQNLLVFMLLFFPSIVTTAFFP